MKTIKVKTVINGCADYCGEFKVVECEYNGTKEKCYECEKLDFCSEVYRAIKEAEGSK